MECNSAEIIVIGRSLDLETQKKFEGNLKQILQKRHIIMPVVTANDIENIRFVSLRELLDGKTSIFSQCYRYQFCFEVKGVLAKLEFFLHAILELGNKIADSEKKVDQGRHIKYGYQIRNCNPSWRYQN